MREMVACGVLLQTKYGSERTYLRAVNNTTVLNLTKYKKNPDARESGV